MNADQNPDRIIYTRPNPNSPDVYVTTELPLARDLARVAMAREQLVEHHSTISEMMTASVATATVKWRAESSAARLSGTVGFDLRPVDTEYLRTSVQAAMDSENTGYLRQGVPEESLQFWSEALGYIWELHHTPNASQPN